MSLITGRRRLRSVVAFLALGVCASAALAAPMAALENRLATPRPAAAQPPPDLISGVSVRGATVNTPGAPVRTLDANQATAFMQAWLADSVFTKLPNVKPPTGLPVSRVTVLTVWNKAEEPVKVLYATDCTTAWVGMPAQSFGWAGVDHERWIAAPQSARVQQAFAGKLQPVRSEPAPSTTTTTPSCTSSQPRTAASTGGGSSASAAWWLVGGGAVVVVGALLFLTVRRRRLAAR